MTRIFLSPPHVGVLEREMVLNAIDSNWVAPLGPHVDEFENEMAAAAGVSDAAALSSGTAALHVALRLLGVAAGDTVVVPTFTFIATAAAATYVNAEPVFVDCDATTWALSPDRLEEALSRGAAAGRLPKAIVTVDLYGQCADYDRISHIAAHYGVPVVEDAAEALGATYRGSPAGSFGAMAVFSFNGNKIITTSGGGMLVSNDASLIREARFLATQARDAAPHYEHSMIGYNYRMSNLLAAVGRAQLVTLRERVRRRREIFAAYRAAFADLPGITFMPIADYGESTCWLTCVLIDPDAFGRSREDVRLHLESLDIEARPTWKPMHLQPVFAGSQVVGGGVAEAIFDQGLCLPSGSSLTDEDIDRVVGAVLSLRP